ncbi:hypothetical protein E4U21_004449 [Claviceps maximensis]|nr:hypothetical protein E4U21_004449 [Claviceps maximensis]
MNDEFMSVRTWQGSIMVSTSLLPQSFDESYTNTSIRPNNPPGSTSSPRPQYRNDSHTEAATPPPPAPPPVPDYWHHGSQATVVAGTVGGNPFDFDGNFYYAPSSPIESSISSHMPTYSTASTPRLDDDVASLQEYPLFSPWGNPGAGFSNDSPSLDWNDMSFAANPGFSPATGYYCSAPTTNWPAQPGTPWRNDGHVQSLRHDTLSHMPPTMSECPGSLKRQGTDLGSVF